MQMTFASSFEIIINACKCQVNALRAVFLNNCECSQRSCARDSWFVLNFRIMLLDLLVGCDVRRKKKVIILGIQFNMSSIPFIFFEVVGGGLEHCFLTGWLGNVCGGRVQLGAR
jgi:hypothetical protein